MRLRSTQHTARSTSPPQHTARSTSLPARSTPLPARSTSLLRQAGCGTFARWLKFNAVGVAGIVVQLAMLALLVRLLHFGYLLSTVLAVEAAILHNFFWHRSYTWADRPRGAARQQHTSDCAGGAVHVPARSLFSSLLRFNLTTGLFSIGGNLVLMRLFSGAAGLDPLIANGIAIASCSIVNFLVSDRFVFAPTELSADGVDL